MSTSAAWLKFHGGEVTVVYGGDGIILVTT